MISPQHPFYQHFADIYGERWPGLCEALIRSEQQVARQNMLSPLSHSEHNEKKWSALETRKAWTSCFWLPEHHGISPERNADGLLDIYIMDPASVQAARALEVQAGDRVLDMCAAPGGKTLILIEALAQQGQLIANDLSAERRERLKKVIQQYVPRDVRDRVWVTGKDAVQFGLKEAEGFDRILLDAPCSGERHLLENPKAMAEWSPRRTENLARRQYALLSAAFLACRPGGRIVYSTCSISPTENDGVVERLLKKKKGAVRLEQSPSGLEAESKGGEKTECGVVFLPDRCQFGPLYFSVLTKLSPILRS